MSNEAVASVSSEPTPPVTPGPSDPPSLISQPPAADPPAEAPKPAEPAPEFTPLTAEAIKLPEGFTADSALMTDFLSITNEAKLPAEVAQKLVDLQIKANTTATEANTTAWNDLQTKWQEEAKALPEIGGAKLDETLGGIAKLITKYGGDKATELNQVFTTTGAGNHPLMVKFLHNIAKELNEPAPVLGAPARSQQSIAESLYPSMQKGA